MITERSTTVVTLVRAHWRSVLAVVAIVAVEEVANDHIELQRPAFTVAAVGLMMTAVSIFLVFRVSEAYARWWEARTLWGSIVNGSRSFARQVTTLLVTERADTAGEGEIEALRREFVYRQIAWVNALRLSLRRQDDWQELKPFLTASELESLSGAANVPTQLLQRQGVRLAEARAAGLLSDVGQLIVDGSLAALHDAQGACERIKNTAFPDRVAFFTRLVAWSVAALLPLGIMDPDNDFDLLDMVVVPSMMLAFVLTERLGFELKNPFENRPNDTPMTSLCRSIEIDLRQQLGEKQLPPRIEPVNGVLM